nr:3-methyl-2-oxobutanoate hydroxymethyltransferase [Solirubrobacterales bacterium]
RGLRTPLLVGDLPFGSYQRSDEQAIDTAIRFVKEAGCEGVKLEGGQWAANRARAMVDAGIPVMGHVGLTPQTAVSLGGFRAQGRTAEAARRLLEDALAIQDAGCFSIVFEAMPAEVAAEIMEHMRVPVIGIGAGGSTDGQVLVVHDMLGIQEAIQPKFVKRYAHVRPLMIEATRAFAAEVRDRSFPAPEHEYAMAPEELERFRGPTATEG